MKDCKKNNKTQGAECINRNSTLISYVYADGPRPTKKNKVDIDIEIVTAQCFKNSSKTSPSNIKKHP